LCLQSNAKHWTGTNPAEAEKKPTSLLNRFDKVLHSPFPKVPWSSLRQAKKGTP